MNATRASATLLILAMLALVSGCSTLYEGKYAFGEGWRKGRVVQITRRSAIAPSNYWQCVREAPTIELNESSYALLAYSGYGRARQRLVPVPQSLDLRENEAVYVNLGRCEDAIAKQAAGPQSKHDHGTVFSSLN